MAGREVCRINTLTRSTGGSNVFATLSGPPTSEGRACCVPTGESTARNNVSPRVESLESQESVIAVKYSDGFVRRLALHAGTRPCPLPQTHGESHPARLLCHPGNRQSIITPSPGPARDSGGVIASGIGADNCVVENSTDATMVFQRGVEFAAFHSSNLNFVVNHAMSDASHLAARCFELPGGNC